MTGVDVAPEMLARAREQDADVGLAVTYRLAAAEDTGLPARAWDVVSAGRCWHGFDRPRAAAEARRLLVEDGALAICYRDYVTTPGSVAAASEELVLAHHPGWPLTKGFDNHRKWIHDLDAAGFDHVETFGFEITVEPARVAGCTRVRSGDGLIEGIAWRDARI